MRQPYIAQESVVPLLVKNKLAIAAQTGVNFAVAVEVRSIVPRAVVVVQVEHGAFADVDEEADVFAAPGVGENEWLAL